MNLESSRPRPKSDESLFVVADQGLRCLRRRRRQQQQHARVTRLPSRTRSAGSGALSRDEMGGTLAVNRERRLAGGIFSAVKFTRAPRRSENVKDRRAMFHPDGGDGGRAAAKCDPASSSSEEEEEEEEEEEDEEEEDFGWWLNDREVRMPSGSRRRATIHRSSDDSDDGFAPKREPESGIGERIELSSLTQDDLDIDLIERDALDTWSDLTASDSEDGVRQESRTVCYTPERLVRSQEYRILVPSPRCFVFPQARFTPASRERKSRRYRKRLSCLIDSEQIGATQLKMLLNLPIAIDARTRAASSPIFGDDDEEAPARPSDEHPPSGAIGSSGSSYDIANSTWDYDCRGLTVRPPSLDDTSGIQSNDWSLETQSDARNTPMCLCDELAIASRSRVASFANDRGEVTSILESLRSPGPGNAMVLLQGGNRFQNGTSSHEQPTRLAVEADGAPQAVPDDPNNWVHRLRDKIKRLRLANEEIHRDIRDLCTDFQRDEERTMNLSNSARHLLQDVHEVRYLDDLLKLMKGEPDRISKRDWPFVLRHSRPHEELNLII